MCLSTKDHPDYQTRGKGGGGECLEGNWQGAWSVEEGVEGEEKGWGMFWGDEVWGGGVGGWGGFGWAGGTPGHEKGSLETLSRSSDSIHSVTSAHKCLGTAG